MDTVNLSKDQPAPEPDSTPTPPPVLDEESILPGWLQSRTAFAATARLILLRFWYRLRYHGFRSPWYALKLLGWMCRGFGRVVKRFSLWIYDRDTAVLRHDHVRGANTPEARDAQKIRQADLHARFIVVLTIAIPILVPILLYLAPTALAVIIGAAAFVYTVKIIPGKEAWELWIAAGAFVGGYSGVDYAVGGAAWKFVAPRPSLLPELPWWTAPAIAAVMAAWLMWEGRPIGKKLATGDALAAAGVAPRLTAPILVRALCSIGHSKMTPKTEEDPGTRIEFLTDPVRNGAGYQVEIQLPHGVVAGDVMDSREQLSSGLRRELGCVWPSQGKRHGGHLSLYVADQAMSESAQAPWPLMKCRPVNLFEQVEMFTNNVNQWVKTTFAYTSWIIGAVPRMGKTYLIRQFGLVAGMDPRSKVYAFDLKGTGDLSPLSEFAHVYCVGDEPEEIAEQLEHIEKLQQEMRRRARAIRELTTEQNPEKGKVTDALASQSPGKYGLIVVVVDECQVWFEEFDDKLPGRDLAGKAVREKFIALVRDLVKRGPALGIVVVLATQKPSAKSIPSEIADMAVGRACFKVSGDKANNQILGPGMYAQGIRATQFGFGDKGVCYVKTEGADAQIARTVHGLHAKQAEQLAVKIRAMRQAAGLLTGQAAGEVEVVEEDTPDFAADVFSVLQQAGRKAMSYAELAAGLADGRPTHYTGWDADTVADRLRAEEIRTDTVHLGGSRKARGTHIDWVRAALDGQELAA